MTSHTSRLFAPLFATGLAITLAACGGAAPSQPTGPAPVVVETPPAAPGQPAAPRLTKPGPNVTPEGVLFNYKHEAKTAQIFLAGNFNDWNPSDSKYLLKDDDGDGVWSITVKLAPGTYQYKYVVDSKWTQDPYGPDAAPDGFGGNNSKFDVK